MPTFDTPEPIFVTVSLAHGDVRLTASERTDIQVDHSGELRASTASGNLSIGRAAGRAELTTGSGEVRVSEVDGAALIKNTNGNSWAGSVTGELSVQGA